jgi:hypothetical protein
VTTPHASAAKALMPADKADAPSPIPPPAAAALVAVLEAVAASAYFAEHGRLPAWATPKQNHDGGES